MDTQEGGGELCYKNKCSNKNQHKIYTGSVYLTYVQSQPPRLSSTILRFYNGFTWNLYNRKF